MQSLYQRFSGSTAAAPVIFLVLFLVIVGGALYLTPRIAAWLDRKSEGRPGYFDNMLTRDPNAPGDGMPGEGRCAPGEEDGHEAD